MRCGDVNHSGRGDLRYSASSHLLALATFHLRGIRESSTVEDALCEGSTAIMWS